MRAAVPYALAASRPRTGPVGRLCRRLERVGLDGVLDDLDRRAERSPVPGEAAGHGYTWEASDRDDAEWWPQGVAALRSGDLLLVSWYARRGRLFRTKGSRISVIDRSDPERARYRHVLLVAPRRRPWGPGAGVVPVHAGGIAVHGDLLYVADTLFGVRLFDLRDVMRGSGVRGYEYVLPQVMRLRVRLRATWPPMRYSFLSVGEVDGRPDLVVGEYRRANQGPPRLVRYALDATTSLPAIDDDGLCRPLAVHEAQPHRMQGAAVHGSTWFVSASAGEDRAGDLYVGAPGAFRRHRGVLPTGPEDLAWSRPGEELWCVSEWPGRRWVFPIATSRWQPPPDPG